MFLIMSAAYVGQELESEFGRLPPSFLPLGNRRLFQHQVKLAPPGVTVHLSVPESYQVSATDRAWLEQNKVKLILTPDGLSLGASLVAAMNLAEYGLETPLHILYGDTLFASLPSGDDIVAVSEIKDSYNWAMVTNDDMQWIQDSNIHLNPESNRVVSGYFKFSQPRLLLRCITQSNWNFLQGLNRYHTDTGLTTVNTDNWFDFGHVNTYYRSKADFTTQRAFNELRITPHWIEKSSIKNNKIAAEANWFDNLPYPLRGYIPQYLGSEQQDGNIRYRLEYLYQTALNELYVFSELPAAIWKQILLGCLEFIKACDAIKAPENSPVNDLEQLFGEKTQQRLNEFVTSQQIDINRPWHFNHAFSVSIQDLLTKSQRYLPTGSKALSVLHGDFCFSNILYDFKTGRIKTIDPRGLTPANELSIYGDTRYDLAKLSHSVLGMYDWIIAGYYQVELDKDNYQITFQVEGSKQHKATQQLFTELVEQEFGLTAANLYAMQIQLFLSMLPLHADDNKRQQALFATAFRLYQHLQRLIQ